MEKYLVIMDRALAAYPPDRMTDWFRKVQKTGVTEHGFPRLTANLGILIAHGLHTDLLPLFTEMMTFVCRDIRHGHCANDFSVRELLCALREIRGAGLVPPDVIEGWRADLAALRAPGCYDKTAKDAFTRNHNWGCFAAASEYLRQAEGLCDASGFLNVELPSQLLNFDENGMYRDPHCPTVYDIVPRAQLCVLLKFGYRGPRADAIRAQLKKGAAMTLRLQSVTGELPFGGRSNQFLFNEAIQAALFAYSAVIFAEDGDLSAAGQLQDAANLSVDAILRNLELYRGSNHAKNRFGGDTGFGCEKYAYFDKYMITLASFTYLWHLLSDERIVPLPCPARTGGHAVLTGSAFHKCAASAGGYTLVWESAADPHYDATGLGRIHKAGVPSALALSVPFAKHPNYRMPFGNRTPLAIAAGLRRGHEDIFPAALDYRVTEENGKEKLSARGDVCLGFSVLEETAERVRVRVRYAVCEKTVTETWTVSADGALCLAECPGETLVLPVPVFVTDGAEEARSTVRDGTLTVCFAGHTYTVSTDNALARAPQTLCNRNGLYGLCKITGKDKITAKFTLE